MIAWGEGDTLTTQLARPAGVSDGGDGETEFRVDAVGAVVKLTGETLTIVQGGREILGRGRSKVRLATAGSGAA